MRNVSVLTASCVGAGVIGATMITQTIHLRVAEFVLGCVLVIIALMVGLTAQILTAITAVHREADRAFEAGFEMGRDKGYLEGRKAPMSGVVSPMKFKIPS